MEDKQQQERSTLLQGGEPRMIFESLGKDLRVDDSLAHVFSDQEVLNDHLLINPVLVPSGAVHDQRWMKVHKVIKHREGLVGKEGGILDINGDHNGEHIENVMSTAMLLDD